MKSKFIFYFCLAAVVLSAAVQADSLSGNYLSGRFARSKGDIESSTSYLEQVYRNDPSNTEVASQLQGMLLLEGRVDEALAATKPGSHDSLSGLLSVLREIKNHHPDQATALLNSMSGNGQLWQPLLLGWVAADSGKLGKPLSADNLHLDIDRAVPLVHYHLALINARAGFTEVAAKDFKAAIQDPKDPPPRPHGAAAAVL